MNTTKLKLFYVQKLLNEYSDDDHGITIPELIDRLDDEYGYRPERKSLYNDFSSLREAGFDVIKKSDGKNVTYHHTNRLFELPELKLLVDIIVSSRIITEKQSRELVKKLEKLTSIYKAGELQRNVILQDRPKTLSESSFENIGILTEAINSNLKISFEYYKWNHKKQLVKSENAYKSNISPSFMQVSADNYYLIAYDESDDRIKHYRIDKMRKIIIQKEKAITLYELDSHRKKVAYSNKLSGMMTAAEKRVTVECEEKDLGIVLDKIGAGAVTIKPMANSNGKYECFFDIYFSKFFMGWLAGVSDCVRLIGSEECVAEYKEYLSGILKAIQE